MTLRIPPAVLVVALGFSLARPALSAAFESANPPKEIAKTYRGKPFQFGYLTVPENRANPVRAIRLAVVILKANNPVGLPVIYLNGGPGSPATSMGVGIPCFEALQERHDVVLVDQRGTGFSQPFLGISRPGAASLREARRRFVARGIDLSAYNTTENAADIADLRVALGYPNVILFGSSYGTFLAQEVMRSHPTGISAVILNGVLPAQGTFVPPYGNNARHAIGELFRDVRRTGPARRAFPYLQRDYFRLLRRLAVRPIRFGGIVISQSDLLGLVQTQIQTSQNIQSLPLLISDICARRASPWLAEHLSPGGSGPSSRRLGSAKGMYYSVLATDWNQPNWMSLTVRATARLRPSIYSEIYRAELLQIVGTTRAWHVPYSPRATRAPLQSPIPTLLLDGRMEAQTPPFGGATVARGLPNSILLTFPRSGHGTGFTSGPALNALLQFALDPSRRPTYSLASLKRPQFYLTRVPDKDARDRGKKFRFVVP